jgi:hypothetical protein
VRPYLRKSHHKKRVDGVTQGVGTEFKPQNSKTKTKTKQNKKTKKLLVNQCGKQNRRSL